MLKRTIAIVAILILLTTIPITANATSSRGLVIYPSITFNGTTATCALVVSANPSDEITATLKLWHGSTCLKGWDLKDENILEFSDTCPVVAGQTYKLTADVSINGVAEPQVSITRTCPKTP